MADNKFYYVMSYDFKENHADVRQTFLESLKSVFACEEIGESAYGIANDIELSSIMSRIQELLTEAFAEKGKNQDKDDKVFLLCNSIKADYNVQDPDSHKIYCYAIVVLK